MESRARRRSNQASAVPVPSFRLRILPCAGVVLIIMKEDPSRARRPEDLHLISRAPCGILPLT
ncbi:MAG TPA: hypothetical protein VFK07_03100 [Candidatus Paceibacterota bacterium]|nr:hypothetical protein [Candidatus Paceibacterota bacterium]